MLDTLSRAALIAAIILALGVLVAGLTGCVTSPEPHPAPCIRTAEYGDTLGPCVVYPGIGRSGAVVTGDAP